MSRLIERISGITNALKELNGTAMALSHTFKKLNQLMDEVDLKEESDGRPKLMVNGHIVPIYGVTCAPFIDLAVGEQLDNIGKHIGCPRGLITKGTVGTPEADGNYRQRLVNHSIESATRAAL